MRFHHSTRRGRNRLASSRLAYHHPTSTSRWSQLGYCRETSIIFNRRLPIEPPASSSGSPSRVQLEPGASESPLELKATTSDLSPMHAGGQFQQQPAPAQQQKQGFGKSKSGRRAGRTLNDQLQDLRLNSAKQTGSGGADNRKLDMEFVRERLVAQVEKHPFWSNKAAQRMQFTSCQERNVYIYELTSYCERRELEWRFESYRGGGIVSSMPSFRRKLSDSGLGGSCSPSGSLVDSPAAGAPGPASGGFYKPLVVAEPALSSPPEAGAGGAGDKKPPAGRWSASSAWKARRENRLLRMEQLSGVSGSEPKASDPGDSPQRQQQSHQAQQAGPAKAMERFIPSPEEVWAIEVPGAHRPEVFTGYVYTCEFPQSSFVKRCHGCQGRGRLKCATCHGVGYEVCLGCSGKGSHKSAHHSSSSLQAFHSPFGASSARNSSRACDSSANSNGYYDDNYNNAASANSDPKRSYGEPGGIAGGAGGSGGLLTSSWAMESCHFCHGLGQKRCWTCAGKAYNHCSACLGTGQLRCFLKLIVTWLNHREESLLNNSDNIIPKERLRLCSGLVLVEQVADRLAPLARQWIDGATGRVDQANQLQQASRKLLDKQRASLAQERLIKQRHKVTQIECHLVNYEWKARRGHFVIYGDERKVYIAKYPFKSICNIT